MVDIVSVFHWIPSLGDGLSWIVEKITTFLAEKLSITISSFQAKLISLMIIGASFYGAISISKKLIKLGLIILLALFFISVLTSIFT